METLAQMLEDYRNGERGLPSYEELVAVVAHGDVLNAKRYEYLRSDSEGIEFRDYGTTPNQWRSDCPSGEELDKIIDAAIAAKEQSC